MDWLAKRRELFDAFERLRRGEYDIAELGLSVFSYQYQFNPVYNRFVNALGTDIHQINSLEQVPCLPISAFKHFEIKTGEWKSEITFESSGTSSDIKSKHHVHDLAFYQRHCADLFERTFEFGQEYIILALLPSYQERKNASLIWMTDELIKTSGDPLSGYYLDRKEILLNILKKDRVGGKKVILLGVSFALMDLMEKGVVKNDSLVIIETGGMKGRRKEITKERFHNLLKEAFGSTKIFSEYGMTELLSQSYASIGSFFKPAFCMKVFPMEINDPLKHCRPFTTGALNIMDLANIDTCAFIATEDIGKVDINGHFSVEGRLNSADLRGCNLMISEVN